MACPSGLITAGMVWVMPLAWMVAARRGRRARGQVGFDPVTLAGEERLCRCRDYADRRGVAACRV